MATKGDRGMINFIIGTLFGFACSVIVYIFAKGMANCIKANEEENQRKEQKKKEELNSINGDFVDGCLVSSKDNENK
jgi:hypothetical protein